LVRSVPTRPPLAALAVGAAAHATASAARGLLGKAARAARVTMITTMPATALALALAGCASVPRAAGEWVVGRLSLSMAAQDAQPAQNATLSFELHGDGARGELLLYTPLGTQIAAARWAPDGASLVTADGERAFAGLDALAAGAFGALGEHVPLAALPDWLAGRAWAEAPSIATDGGFEQLGWRVDLRGRDEGRIVARRAAPPAVVLRVQLERSAS